jgi:hypothetical protein
MSTVKQPIGTRLALSYSGTGLSTLSAGCYVQSVSAYDCSVNQPLDVIIEGDFGTSNTPAGNKQVVLFIQESLDGTNFRTGPISSNVTTREPNLRLLGTVPITTTAIVEMGSFSLVQVLGYVPLKFFVTIKNDYAVNQTSGTVWISEISNTIA